MKSSTKNAEKRVLLTGSTGLIGKYAIQPLINAGFEVFALHSKEQNSKYEMQNLHWICTDLLNSTNIIKIFQEIKPEYLLHFAWDTTPGVYLESETNLKWLKSSLEMLTEFKKQGGKRAVFAGTCFEYGFKDTPLKEDDLTDPKTLYAKCKNQLRESAVGFCEKNDLSFAWGRIFYVFGEGENKKRLVPKIINDLKEQMAICLSTGELVKDYMFAGDVAEAFVKLLCSGVQGCVNISSGEGLKIRELVTLIAQKMYKAHLVTFADKESKEPPIIVGDDTRLKNEVRFTPKHSLSEGLDIVIG